MHRRTVLRAGLSLAGLAGVDVVGARQTGRRRATPDDETYAPPGRLAIPGAADCRLSVDGETAFVAVGDGFVAADVETLAPVAEVRAIEADRESGPLTGVADLAVDGGRLLVPGPANPRSGRLAGAALFDVADPAAPERVAFYETDFPIHNAALDGGLAYLTAGHSLVVVDLSVDDPALVGAWSLVDVDARWADVPPPLWVLHDLRVAGDLAVLSQWDAGTWLVDVSTPSAITVVGRAGGEPVEKLTAVEDEAVRATASQLPGNHHSAALTEDGALMAVGAEAFDGASDDGAGGPGGIDLYDVRDPTAPVRLGGIDAPPSADESRSGIWSTAHDFAFAGDRLFSAWYQGGVRIHDVADPGEPTELAWWRRPAEAAFWTARPAAGDSFVATATTLPGRDLFSGLYRFPNRPGEQADPPSLTAPASPTTATPRHEPTTGRPSPSPPPTATPGQPGFGPAAALGGIAGLAAWRRWGRERR